MTTSKLGALGEEPKSEHLHKDHLIPAEEHLQTVEKSINDLMVQQKFFEFRKSKQNEG